MNTQEIIDELFRLRRSGFKNKRSRSALTQAAQAVAAQAAPTAEYRDFTAAIEALTPEPTLDIENLRERVSRLNLTLSDEDRARIDAALAAYVPPKTTKIALELTEEEIAYSGHVVDGLGLRSGVSISLHTKIKKAVKAAR